jgi:ankyrin repeat protein
MARERQEVARFLVARGCRTDVLLAAALGDLDLVRAHLDRDPEAIRTRVSAQHFPMRNPRAGGTIYIWTIGEGRTAHLAARDHGHEEVFRFLMDRSPDDLRLAIACELGDRAAADALLAARPGIARTLPDAERGKVAEAAWGENTEGVRLLLAAGWPADGRGKHGATALHFAAWLGMLEMVREILRYAPPLAARDEEFGGTPLDWALHGSEHSYRRDTGDYAGVVAALLAAGAAAPAADDARGNDAVRAVLRGRDRA